MSTEKMEANIAGKTGKTVPEWVRVVKTSGLEKHGQIVKFLKADHGFTHGYANLVAHRALHSAADEQDDDDLVTAQYAGPKAGLKPIYDKVSHRVRLESPDDFDTEVAAWLKRAFEAAG